MKLSRALTVGAILGIVAALIVLLQTRITGEGLGWMEILLWPGSLILFANDLTQDKSTWLKLSSAVLSNGLLYAIVAGAVYAIFIMLRPSRRRAVEP